jgi:hypothetical protein
MSVIAGLCGHPLLNSINSLVSTAIARPHLRHCAG